MCSASRNATINKNCKQNTHRVHFLESLLQLLLPFERAIPPAFVQFLLDLVQLAGIQVLQLPLLYGGLCTCLRRGDSLPELVFVKLSEQNHGRKRKKRTSVGVGQHGGHFDDAASEAGPACRQQHTHKGALNKNAQLRKNRREILKIYFR